MVQRHETEQRNHGSRVPGNGRKWQSSWEEKLLGFSLGFSFIGYGDDCKHPQEREFTLPETNIAHENPIFPGKYHQNGGVSMAMLVYRRVVCRGIPRYPKANEELTMEKTRWTVDIRQV